MNLQDELIIGGSGLGVIEVKLFPKKRGKQRNPIIDLGTGGIFKIKPDAGCWVAPHCLSCPREICVEDEPRVGNGRLMSHVVREERNADIKRRYSAAESIYNIAKIHNVDYTLVKRIVRENGNGCF